MVEEKKKRPLRFQELTRISPKYYTIVDDLGPALDRKLRELRESGELDLRPISDYSNPFDIHNDYR